MQLTSLPPSPPARLADAAQEAAERIVLHWLALNGNQVTVTAPSPGTHHIHAVGKDNRLIRILGAVLPLEPVFLRDTEAQHMAGEAGRAGAQAWEVRVQLNRQLHAIWIRWRRLLANAS
jgi:hypothetical protein